MSLIHATIPSTIAITNHVEAEVVVQLDPGQIEQVLVNLNTKAAQAIGNQAGHVDVRISVRDLSAGESRLRAGRYVEIQVIDDDRAWPTVSAITSLSHSLRPIQLAKAADRVSLSRMASWTAMSRRQLGEVVHGRAAQPQ